eukprot:COSAG01_NODE_475_length_16519_cov_168.890621_2_plen_1708_part_00
MYNFITEFTSQCQVTESSGSATGNCDIDVDECISSPCLNGASCTDSITDAAIVGAHYSCSCSPGFANGICTYPYLSDPRNSHLYDAECTVAKPTSSLAGNCDIDVDECASNPCHHEGVCTTVYVSNHGTPNSVQSRTVRTVGSWSETAAASYQWSNAKRYSCSCKNFTEGSAGGLWPGLPAVLPRTRPVGTLSLLQSQKGQQTCGSLAWDPDTDCQKRMFDEMRCEPGQEPANYNSGHMWCVDCAPGRYSPAGTACMPCLAPLILPPDQWWCPRRQSSRGTVLQEAGKCTRNLRCESCTSGMIPNANRTACQDAMASAAEDTTLASLGDSVSGTETTATFAFSVTAPPASAGPCTYDGRYGARDVSCQLDNGAQEAALEASFITELAASMNIAESDLNSQGLVLNADGDVELSFTLVQGTPSSALSNLQNVLQDPNTPEARTLVGGLGLQADSISVVAGCPAGTTKADADVFCRKCPFPQITRDTITCEPCPKGQVPTDKGDQCRCGDGHYNATRGIAMCFDNTESMKSADLDTAAANVDICAPCPDCASCADGVLRVKAGYSPTSFFAAPELALDTIAGIRPLYACMQSSGIEPKIVCPGDEGPYPVERGVNRLAAAPGHWWENNEKCGQVFMDGTGQSNMPCLNAGVCTYSPPSPRGATTIRTELCSPVNFALDNWCGEGYSGPLCSNCATGYGREGIDRKDPCISCADTLGAGVWVVILVLVALAVYRTEKVCCGSFNPGEVPEETGEAPLGVALVIGNGSYDLWPSLEAATNDADAFAHAMEVLGYSVIKVKNGTKATITAAIKEFEETVARVTDPDTYTSRMLADPNLNPWPSARSPGLAENEVATVVFYSGHATQLRPEDVDTPRRDGQSLNCLVPTDAKLNPSIDEVVVVDDLFVGPRVTQGPNIILIDAGHAVATGPFDELERDTFRCPISGVIMRDPVKLFAEAEGWAYEKWALQRLLAKSSATAHNTRFSPLTGAVLEDPTPDEVTDRGTDQLYFDDKQLQADIQYFMERSTLRAMELPQENCILVLAAEPNRFSSPSVDDPTKHMTFGQDGKRGLFTSELMRVITERDSVTNMMAKVRALTSTDSDGVQVPWSIHNLRDDSFEFSLSGKFPFIPPSPAATDETVPHKLENIRLGAEQLEVTEQQESKDQESMKGAIAQVLSQLRVLRPTILIIIGMGQVLGGVGYAFSVPYPESFKWVLLQFKLFTIDFFGGVRLGCMFETWTAIDNFYAQVLVIPTLLGGIYGVYKIRDLLLERKGEPPPSQKPTPEHIHGGQVRQDLRALALEVMFTFLFLVYPVISQTVFLSFQCQTLDVSEGASGEVVMLADFQVDCDSDEYTALVASAVLAVCIYPIGIPGTLFFLMFKNRKSLQREGSKARANWKVLVGAFKLEYWYWFCLEMFRKVILTGIMIFWNRGSLNQLIMGMQVQTIFLIATVYHRPYIHPINNNLKTLTDVCTLATFNIAVLLNRRIDKDLEEEWSLGWTNEFIGIFLILINLVLPLAALVFEWGRLRLLADREVDLGEINGIPWPFARWQDGKFRGASPGDTSQLALLRRGLDKVDEAILIRDATRAGVAHAKKDNAVHSARDTKAAIITAIMDEARKEGQGWGPWRQPTGVVRSIFIEREILERKKQRERKLADKEDELARSPKASAAGGKTGGAIWGGESPGGGGREVDVGVDTEFAKPDYESVDNPIFE